MTISFAQIPLGSIVKLGFFANLALWLLLGLLAGIGGSLGLPIVSFGNAHVFGIAALVTAVGISLVFAILGAVLFTIGALLVRLLGRRAPMLELRPSSSSNT